MKTTLLLFSISLLFCFFQKPPTIIKAGQEVDGFKLNNSLVKEAILKYGKNNDFSQGIACGEQTFYQNRFIFSKQGITVISLTIDGIDNDINASKINKITVAYPCNAITEKGINLKTDKIENILSAYGIPEDKDTSELYINLHYYSKGISFKCDKIVKCIKAIEVYNVGSSPDSWY